MSISFLGMVQSSWWQLYVYLFSLVSVAWKKTSTVSDCPLSHIIHIRALLEFCMLCIAFQFIFLYSKKWVDIWIKLHVMMQVLESSTMTMKSYRYQAEMILKDHLLADAFLHCVSMLAGIFMCTMVYPILLLISTLNWMHFGKYFFLYAYWIAFWYQMWSCAYDDWRGKLRLGNTNGNKISYNRHLIFHTTII